MARICVDITKIREEGQTCLYEIKTEDEGGANFFVKINKICRQIFVYLKKDSIHPLLSIKTDAEQDFKKVKAIPYSILLHVIWRCMQTYELEVFPNSLSFCS